MSAPPTRGMRARIAVGLRQALMTAAAAWISYIVYLVAWGGARDSVR